MTFHAKRSPSQAKRFLACPGALVFCDSLPPEQHNHSSPAAQMGTAAHGLVERCLRSDSNPEDYRGRIIELGGDEESVAILRQGAKTPGKDRTFFEVDSDMIDGAEMMTTYVRERCKALGVKESALQLETRTNPLPERDDTSGTADVTIDAWPGVLEVIDYKNGWNVVEHEDNEQLLAYLLGKALESEFVHEQYRVTVVQPNAGHEEGRVRSFDTTAKELIAFQWRYREGIERCEAAEHDFGDPNMSREDWSDIWLHAGPHCLFCPAQAVCPARRQLAQIEAKIDFAEEPRELISRICDQDGAEVARVLYWAPTLEALIKAAELWALRSMESGHKVPGFKLVRGRSNRRLREDIPEGELVGSIVKGGYVAKPSSLYTEPKLLSGPQIEKLVPKAKREQFEKEFLFKPEGKLTVAPEKDPRLAITCSTADDFDDEESGDKRCRHDVLLGKDCPACIQEIRFAAKGEEDFG